MINVKLTTASPLIPHERLTPGSKGVWDDCRFFIDEPVAAVDWWVVMDNLSEKQTLTCPPEHTILICQETEFIRTYNRKFLNQFAAVITCQRGMKHPNKIYTHQAHPWYVGWFGSGSGVDPKDFKKVFMTYDRLKAMKVEDIPKTKILSNVTSNKVRTEGQQARRAFINKVKERLGDKFDMFGSGINHLKDKWDGIAPYKYYLAIDNSYVEDYWTSNLADALLAGAYPIYYTHPSVFKYFSPNAMTLIDIDKPEEALNKIEEVINGNYYEKHLKDIWEARAILLDKYNLFALITDTIHTLAASQQASAPKLITLKAEKRSGLKKKIVETLRGKGVLYTIPRNIYRAYRNIRYGHH